MEAQRAQGVAPSDPTLALDVIDKFVSVATKIAAIPVLRSPEYRSAAEGLYKIAEKLLVSNEYMAKWLNRFLYFDFRSSDARGQFLELAREYRTKKAGPEFRNMKFSCSDLYAIYNYQVEGRLTGLLAQDKLEEVRRAFEDLRGVDDDLVEFIYNTLVGRIDRFVNDAEHHIDQDQVNLNPAEKRRLEFRVESAELSEHLERLGNGLSDLILHYAHLAGRPVTLETNSPVAEEPGHAPHS